jgi:hypothetical protein
MPNISTDTDRLVYVRDHALRDLIEWLDQARDNLSHLAARSRNPACIGTLEDAHNAIAEAAACLRQVRDGGASLVSQQIRP